MAASGMQAKRISGFTMTELLVVITLIVVLISLGMFSYSGYQERYTVETKIRELHIDLMKTRVRAMERSRAHFIVLAARQYTVYEDTYDAPDGNGVPDTAGPNVDTAVFQKDLASDDGLVPAYGLAWSLPADDNVTFTTRGLVDPNDLDGADGNRRTICIVKSSGKVAYPEYDCLVIEATRINVGRMADKKGGCTSANCETR